ncbi:MAG: hypothetical protein IT563_26210 [Alphaproteobacteria bacterium]|nr:hypothetical protein [Alphaproteobacteria bacterium]
MKDQGTRRIFARNTGLPVGRSLIETLKEDRELALIAQHIEPAWNARSISLNDRVAETL